MNYPVSVVKCNSYDENTVREAFDRLLENIGGLNFVKPGMTVAIKVNLVTAIKPEKAATTHPALVSELCRRITEMGATPIVGDSPGGLFTGVYLKGVYSATQMTNAVKFGGKLNSDFSVSKCGDFSDAIVLKDFEYTSWLTEADAVINFAKLKTHGMMSMSAAVKNLFGIIPGTVKPEYHYRFPNPKDFANMLVDINEFIKCDLNIIDGVVGMEGNGPTMGVPREIGIIAASKSSYDLDTVCARTIGLSAENVPTCQVAIERGLGHPIEEIEAFGDGLDVRIDDYKNIERANNIEFFCGLIGLQGFVNRMAKWALSTRPVLKDRECVGCKKCFEICPAKAITMTKGKPHIDRTKCIRCFCCQEFCPKGALKVYRPLPARILTKKPKN